MIVVDTNVVAYMVIHGTATADAERVRAKDRQWTAPSLLRYELMNVVAGEVTAGRLGRDAALRTFRRAMNLVTISKLDADPLFVFNISKDLRCSSYDLHALWLAMEMGASLVTANKQLIEAHPTVAVDMAKFG